MQLCWMHPKIGPTPNPILVSYPKIVTSRASIHHYNHLRVCKDLVALSVKWLLTGKVQPEIRRLQFSWLNSRFNWLKSVKKYFPIVWMKFFGMSCINSLGGQLSALTSAIPLSVVHVTWHLTVWVVFSLFSPWNKNKIINGGTPFT